MMVRIRILLLAVVATITIIVSACRKSTVDYSGADVIENALDNGEDLSGKIVSLEVNHSNTFMGQYGYMLYAGEYLVLCSDDNWKVDAGEEICIKILSVATVRDDYIIKYEMLSDVDVKD